ncbi:MAG: HD domain-containing protein [Paludibacteraceae bacterium]|nr:HD domain-containing protein [Paludibacteraceae bacterium]
MKTRIIELLRSTNRKGMENVITWLSEKSDFFTAPASTMFHGNYNGGLAEHSLNVSELSLDLRDMLVARKPELKEVLSEESIIIAALLHDICKANIYKSVVKKRQNAAGYWEEYNAFTVDYAEFPMGHGEKSVIRLLQLGLQLTDDEMLAIRWHMTAWELPFQSAEAKAYLNAAKNKCPLLTIIQTADGLASAILETK